MVWLELNSVESCKPLSNILTHLSLVCKRIYFSNVKSYYTDIHPLLYGLHRYTEKYFVSIVVNRRPNDVLVNILSSDSELIDKIIDELSSKHILPEREEELNNSMINELINTRKYTILDFYFKLSLRNYLYRMKYQPKIIGRKTLWSRGDENVLYSFDVDIDPDTMKGCISVDIKIPSSITLWDKIIGENLGRHEIEELIDTSVMVRFGNKHAYGKIYGFIYKRVSESLIIDGKLFNLVDYYRNKGIGLDPNEYPIVLVEIINPEPRGNKRIFHYPPSEVRLFLSSEKPDPDTRYDKINGVLNDVIKHFNVQGISFMKTPIRYKDHINMIHDIELKYGDRDRRTSPLYSMQRLGAKPLHGPVYIPKLIMLLPKNIEDKVSSSKTIEMICRVIQALYENYGLGIINKVEISFYEVVDTPDDQKLMFSEKLTEIMDNNTPSQTLIMPVINHGYLYRVAKQLCSDKFFHARVADEETFNNIVSSIIINLGIINEKHIKEFMNNITKGTIEDKQLISTLSNIVFSIYVEFLLQKEIYNHRIPNKLTWALAKPADDRGESLYIGYDVSRSTRDKNDIAVALVLYDSYGYMLNAVFRRVRGEKLSDNVLESILLTLFKPLERRKSLNRLVIYKDGGIRSKSEFSDIMSVFTAIGKRIGLNKVDIVGVIKRHNLRLFARKKVKKVEKMINPRMGIWIKMWNIVRHGVYAERALIVSSEAKAGGTVKPVLLERYGRETSEKTINEIVREYLRLCRLDYWNPINGINKYPLPIFMADKLAYLALQGVQIKTP